MLTRPTSLALCLLLVSSAAITIPLFRALFTTTSRPRTEAVALEEVLQHCSAKPTTICIEGDQRFVEWTRAALDLLRSRAPEWLCYLECTVISIESVPEGSGAAVLRQAILIGDLTAHPTKFNKTQQLAWYASCLVHETSHIRLYLDKKYVSRQAAEVACLSDQKAVLNLVCLDADMQVYVQELIDNSDDPARQYWKVGERYW